MHAPVAAADPAGGWDSIIACESGGNPTAQNPHSTASGLYQFLRSSWLAYGGGQYAPEAKMATPAQQTAIANHAYALSGLTPWAASQRCWGGKVTTSAPRHAAPPAPAVPLPVSASVPRHAAGAEVTVQPGDCLSEIAAANGLADWQALFNANRDVVSDPTMIYPGQVLHLPA